MKFEKYADAVEYEIPAIIRVWRILHRTYVLLAFVIPIAALLLLFSGSSDVTHTERLALHAFSWGLVVFTIAVHFLEWRQRPPYVAWIWWRGPKLMVDLDAAWAWVPPDRLAATIRGFAEHWDAHPDTTVDAIEVLSKITIRIYDEPPHAPPNGIEVIAYSDIWEGYLHVWGGRAQDKYHVLEYELGHFLMFAEGIHDDVRFPEREKKWWTWREKRGLLRSQD